MNVEDYEKIESMISRHIGVFAESINHKFDILVEGHRMLSEKIDRVEERLNKRIDCLEHKLDAVAAQTEKNTIAVKELSSRVDALEVRTEQNTIAVKELSSRVDALEVRTEQNTVAVKEQSSKVDALEAKTEKNTVAIQGLSPKLDDLAADLAAHRRDTEAHPRLYKVQEDD